MTTLAPPSSPESLRSPLSSPPQLKVTGHGSLEPDVSPVLGQRFLGTSTCSQHCSHGANWAWQPAPSIPGGNLSGQRGRKEAGGSQQSPFYKASVEPCGAREEAKNWPELPERNHGKPGLDATGLEAGEAYREGPHLERGLT